MKLEDLSFELPRTTRGSINVQKLTNEMFEEICKLTPFITDKSRKTLRERVYCLTHDLDDFPKCKQCGNTLTKWHGAQYSVFCSFKCGANNSAIISKRESTNLKRFGTRYPLEADEQKLKSRSTSLEKYGTEHPSKSKEVRDKLSISLAKNYKERRNEEGSDYAGIVYILHFPEIEAVKIGLTSNTDSRFKGLEKDFGPFKILNLIETETCRKLESYFHEKFAEFRICLEEGHGRTEFFKDEIMEMIE